MLWTDNMLIPKGAAHKGTAELLIDYYYQPEVAAEVNARHRNDLFLPEAPLEASLCATTDIAQALAGAPAEVKELGDALELLPRLIAEIESRST